MTSQLADIWFDTLQLPLQSVLQIQETAITQREIGLLTLQDQQGYIGIGEISPLPGLHRETIADLAALMPSLQEHISRLEVDATLATSWQSIEVLAKTLELPPSLHFGLDMAMANLWAARTQTPWSRLRGPLGALSVPLQGLLWGPKQALLAQLQQQQEAGYRAFKWKVARLPLPEEIALCRDIQAHLAPESRLRLDANRRWSWEEANAFVQGIELSRIDYIEEPLAQPSQLSSFAKITGARIALDESLDEFAQRHAAEGPGLAQGALPNELATPMWTSAAGWVAKPQVLGGWTVTSQWHHWAQEHQLSLIISSAFETGLGLAFLAQCAAILAPGMPAGLDTQRWYREDLLPSLARCGAIQIQDAHDLTMTFCTQWHAARHQRRS